MQCGVFPLKTVSVVEPPSERTFNKINFPNDLDMVGRTQQLAAWAKAQSVEHVSISLFCEQHDALICMPVRAHGARQRACSQYVCAQQVVGAKRPGALQRARSSSESVETVVGTVHFGARQRARSCADLRARV